MSYSEGHCRTQRLLLPELRDDYVTDDNPVRVMAAYAESRDLASRGFARAQAALTGRPASDPRDLLKRSIYGYLNRMRSSRRLERETHRNVELIWLLRKLSPDFKTIADVRKTNTTALQALFREFVLLCRQWDLFGAERLAIDGSQFKAVNNKHKNFTQAKLEKALKDIAEKVEQYWRDLDASDREESTVHQPTREERQEKIARLKERQKRDRGLVQEIKASGAPQLARTDPDSRAMPKSPKVAVGYNVQMAVDRKQKLIVEQDVTKAITDDEQLSPMAMSAKATLGVDQRRAVADMGYSHGHEIKACEAADIDASVPTPSTSAHTKLGLLGKERFTYDPEKDGYRCPAGEELTCRCDTTELGRHLRYYAPGACRRCPMKEQCTRNKHGRRMTRWVDEPILESMEERLKAHPEIMQERTPIVEHPCGTIKHAKEQGYFLMKGLKNVRAAFRLSGVAYTLKRVLNLLGGPQLLGALS